MSATAHGVTAAGRTMVGIAIAGGTEFLVGKGQEPWGKILATAI